MLLFLTHYAEEQEVLLLGHGVHVAVKFRSKVSAVDNRNTAFQMNLVVNKKGIFKYLTSGVLGQALNVLPIFIPIVD